jgi:antitoxin ParD1/3/4
MATETLHISLPDTLRRYVEERVREGHYGNTSEFIRELIRRDLDERRAKRERLEENLLEAITSLDRGEGHEVTPEYWQDLRQRARARLAETAREGDR